MASAPPQRLHNELDPLHVSASHCTDADVVLGSLGALRHAELLRSELWERILLCPAFGLKYVEVSCRTNYDVARMERMLLLGLRQLPSLAQVRQAQGGGKGGKGIQAKRKQAVPDQVQELLAAIGLASVGTFFSDAIASVGGAPAADARWQSSQPRDLPPGPGGEELEGQEVEAGEESSEKGEV